MRKHMPFAVVVIALASLLACGRGDDDATSERVISSPESSPTIGPLDTATPSTTSEGRGREGSPPPDDLTDSPRREAQRTDPPRTVSPATLAGARVKLTRVASMNQPLAMAIRGGDANLYIAEKGGRVRVLRDGRVGATVLDISGQVSTGGEQGLLGLAFAPSGDKFYVNFTNRAGDTVIREYRFSGGRGTLPRDVLQIDQPFANHNGGNLAFGRDGYLYIGMGDGGSGGDPQNRAQNLEDLLGKMLRIDPDPVGSQQYTSPRDNPFVGRSGRDEIWAYGLRNPWRWSFDRSTGALWIGDVGQQSWEEVNVASGRSNGGENYGWRRMEGRHSHAGGTEPSNHHAPVYEYARADSNCAVTGGYVYRGSRIRALSGAYVFADHCVGRLRAFVLSGGRSAGHRFLGPQADRVASFGQDQRGELYVLSLSGGVYRLDAA